jgi:hypothetical protein
VQYISFLFFQQLKQNPSALLFQDKLNLIVAVLFMFVALIYTVASFVIFSHLLSKRKFKVLFPHGTQNKVMDMMMLVVLGPGRNLFLGFVQAFDEDFPLQMLLLLGANALTLIFMSSTPQHYHRPYKMKIRFVFTLIIMLFLLCGFLNHYSLIF